MDDLLAEFLGETGEQLDELDAGLVRFEQDPHDQEMLNTIFRVAHSIKGTCGFFDLPRLAKLAHAAEALMGRYRDGKTVSADGVTAILASLTRFKEILAEIACDGVEPSGTDEDLIVALNELCEASETDASLDADPLADAPAADSVAGHAREPSLPENLRALEEAWHEDAAADFAAPIEAVVGLETAVAEENYGECPSSEDGGDPSSLANAPRAQSVRVAVDTLDTLMTTVSELVLARNQLFDVADRSDLPTFSAPLQRLSAVTVEIQEAVMKARMQPIANAWQKLPVLVRTLSVELGKPIEIDMSGGDAELDRQVLEAIKEPLTHMVRNAADHGLEHREERLAAGKPETGHISISASQQGGNVVVSIADDGRGLNLEALRHQAVAKGIATQKELDFLTDDEAYGLIFTPGFSTAETVSEISGRGVGMDVVRSNIESVGGTVELAKTSPMGTTFVVTIPLTLAIMSALIVEAGGMSFAIPQFGVVELVRLGEAAGHPVERINGAPVLRLRDNLIPLVDLAVKLELRAEEDTDRDLTGHTAVILQNGGSGIGVLVDKACRTEEIVVKPLSNMLRQARLFSGSTILGDGRVIMIVDPSALAETVGRIDGAGSAPSKEQDQAQEERAVPLLLFRAGNDVLKALPLGAMSRLENIAADQVTVCDGGEVVQYREGLLPLIRFSEADPGAQGQTLAVLVFVEGDQAAGLVVDEIVDIVDAVLSIDVKAGSPGIAGVAMVGGQAVELVDAAHYLAPTFDTPVPRRKHGEGAPPHLLLIDDSRFFREMLAPLLQGNGYRVTSVSSGEEALQLEVAGEAVDVIVSDLDMPGMDGISFARHVKRSKNWSSVPLIALSSQPSVDLAEGGRLACFEACLGKFDRHSLMRVLSGVLEVRGEAA